MPLIVPATLARNLTPTSTRFVSEATPSGTALGLQMVAVVAVGAGTVTVTPADGVSMLPLSSTARLFSVTKPVTSGVQLYVQLSRPLAGCQVTPPSVDTSTPPTTPPASVAVPLTITLTPLCSVAP